MSIRKTLLRDMQGVKLTQADKVSADRTKARLTPNRLETS